MKVTLAATADYANTTPDSKLNISGLFGRLPWLGAENPVPQMFVVFVLQIEPEEYGKQRRFGVSITGPSGEPTLPVVEGDAMIPHPAEGDTLKMNQIVGLSGVRFPVPGNYTVHFTVDGESIHRIPLPVYAVA